MYFFCIFIGNYGKNKLTYLDIAQAKRLHGTFRFIDNPCALNDGGEFQKSHTTKFTPSNRY